MKVNPEQSCERVIRNRDDDEPISVKITHQNGRVTIEAGEYGVEQHCFTLMHKFERKFRVLVTAGTASYNPDFVYLHKAFLYDMRFPLTSESSNEQAEREHERQAQIDLDRELEDLVDIEEIFDDAEMEYDKEHHLAKLTHSDLKLSFSDAFDLDHIIDMLPKQMVFTRQRMTQAQNQMAENVQYYTYVSAPMGNSREFGDQWNTIRGVQDTLKLLNDWIANATTHLIDIE